MPADKLFVYEVIPKRSGVDFNPPKIVSAALYNANNIVAVFVIIAVALGINGSQTENATTSWTFSALAYDEADVTCAECAQDNSVLGYMVYAPCGDVAQAVKALVVIGGGVTVAESGEAQIPVRYVMDDDSLVQPTYTDLTYQSQAQGTATVNTSGVVEGVAAGSTTVTITVTSKPTVTAVCNVTVTGA